MSISVRVRTHVFRAPLTEAGLKIARITLAKNQQISIARGCTKSAVRRMQFYGLKPPVVETQEQGEQEVHVEVSRVLLKLLKRKTAAL